MARFKETFISFDWILTGAAALLLIMSLAMLFSTAPEGTSHINRFLRQAISFGGASVIYLLVSAFPYHHLRRYAVLLYLVGVGILLLVAQIAPVIRGTTSRLELSGIQIQPSEFVKVAVIIFLAWFFAQKGVSRTSVLISVAFVGTVIALVVLEPDFGQAALIIALWIAWVVFLGVPWSVVSVIVLVGITSFAACWVWLFADYQKARLVTFLDPAQDPQGAGYNVVQSIVALGSGGLFGRGLGHGPQSQLKFLPEQHTDFILASIGEELGFVGIALVISLYFVMLWRILHIAKSTEDLFGQYLAIGVYLLLLISFFISAGMNMGLLPVTGVPLPLVSYGGSNLVSSFIMLGIVQSVNAHSRWVKKSPIEISEFT